MNYLLRVAHASFASDGEQFVAPFSLNLAGGESLDLAQPSNRAASIVARMCAGIVKPTQGAIYVGDYETRLQPPQAKRLVGFVDAEGFAGNEHSFHCEVAFRAHVWGVDRRTALARAWAMLAELGGEDAYARAIALALVAEVKLIVLDQPPPTSIDAARKLIATAGLVSTSVVANRSAAFASTA